VVKFVATLFRERTSQEVRRHFPRLAAKRIDVLISLVAGVVLLSGCHLAVAELAADVGQRHAEGQELARERVAQILRATEADPCPLGDSSPLACAEV